MSKDGTLFICHPKDNGEITLSDGSEAQIFECADEEIWKLKLSDGSQLPTLEWLILEAKDYPEVELHVELKAPLDEAVFPKYDYKKAVRLASCLLQRQQALQKS